MRQKYFKSFPSSRFTMKNSNRANFFHNWDGMAGLQHNCVNHVVRFRHGLFLPCCDVFNRMGGIKLFELNPLAFKSRALLTLFDGSKNKIYKVRSTSNSQFIILSAANGETVVKVKQSFSLLSRKFVVCRYESCRELPWLTVKVHNIGKRIQICNLRNGLVVAQLNVEPVWSFFSSGFCVAAGYNIPLMALILLATYIKVRRHDRNMPTKRNFFFFCLRILFLFVSHTLP